MKTERIYLIEYGDGPSWYACWVNVIDGRIRFFESAQDQEGTMDQEITDAEQIAELYKNYESLIPKV